MPVYRHKPSPADLRRAEESWKRLYGKLLDDEKAEKSEKKSPPCPPR